LCFEAHGQEFWHGSLRPGDPSANPGVIGFLERCAAKLPGRVARARVRLRADAGFFGGKLLGFLEANRWGCVIVAKPYPTIRRRALSARFEKLGGGWAAGEFSPQAHGWPKARRFVVVRRPVPEDPQAAAQWLATVAFFQTLLLACNLGPGFKRLCRPKSYGAATVETVRRDFLAVPGRWVNRAPRQGLHLPRDYPWRAEWLGAARAIRKLRLRQKNLNLSVNLAHASNVDALFYAPGTLHMHF
jgi:hypothetical protein